MARTIRMCTTTLPCAGLEITDVDIPVSRATSGANAGKLVKTTDDSKIEGQVVAVHKQLDELSLDYNGIHRYALPDTVTLSNADLGKGIKGDASAGLKLVAYSSTYDPNLRGNVIDWDNTTGDKWVDVVFVGTTG